MAGGLFGGGTSAAEKYAKFGAGEYTSSDFESYVDSRPDLAAAWSKIESDPSAWDSKYWIDKGATSKSAFGRAHAAEDAELYAGTYGAGGTKVLPGTPEYEAYFPGEGTYFDEFIAKPSAGSGGGSSASYATNPFYPQLVQDYTPPGLLDWSGYMPAGGLLGHDQYQPWTNPNNIPSNIFNYQPPRIHAGGYGSTGVYPTGSYPTGVYPTEGYSTGYIPTESTSTESTSTSTPEYDPNKDPGWDEGGGGTGSFDNPSMHGYGGFPTGGWDTWNAIGRTLGGSDAHGWSGPSFGAGDIHGWDSTFPDINAVQAEPAYIAPIQSAHALDQLATAYNPPHALDQLATAYQPEHALDQIAQAAHGRKSAVTTPLPSPPPPSVVDITPLAVAQDAAHNSQRAAQERAMQAAQAQAAQAAALAQQRASAQAAAAAAAQERAQAQQRANEFASAQAAQQAAKTALARGIFTENLIEQAYANSGSGNSPAGLLASYAQIGGGPGTPGDYGGVGGGLSGGSPHR